MKNFCQNCGKELKENADVCLNCGVAVNKNNTQYATTQVTKIPGNGMSIAGMILGIIAAVWTLFELLAVTSISSGINELLYTNYVLPKTTMLLSFAFGYTLFSLIPSLIGLPLSIAGLVKHKSGKNITGLILNLISLIAVIVFFIYILSF